MSLIISKLLIALTTLGSLLAPNFGAVKYELSPSETPYGVWISPTGETKYYDQDKKFYTNTEEIKQSQKPKPYVSATST